MTPQELKEYFAGKDLPQTLQLLPGTHIANMEAFLSASFSAVEAFRGDISQCPAWWRLLRLYELLSGKAAGAAKK